jgi:hypothetical protein
MPRVMLRDLGVAALAAVILLPVLTPRLYASDEIQYFSYLRSLWFDRDVSFENEYRALLARGVSVDSGFADTNLALTTDTGLRPNFGTMGSAILWAPFYAVGDVVARTMRRAGSDVAVDGYSRPYVVAVAVGSVVYGLLALVLAASSARALFAADHTGRPAAGRGAAAAAVVLAGTPLLFYMCIAPVFAHATSAFAVSLFVFIWLRVRQSWRVSGLVALGAAAGLMAMVREQDAFLVIGPVVDMLRAIIRRQRQGHRFEPAPRVAALCGGAIAGVVTVLPQIWAYVLLNGRPGPSPLVARKMSWSAPHAAGVLFSPEHGFFLWTPLAVLAIAGLVLAVMRNRSLDPAAVETRWVAVVALVMIASQVYVAGSVESWTVAGSFGQRRFVALTPLLVIGLAALRAAVAKARPVRLAVGGAILLCLWWNLGLMAQFGLHTMDRQRLTLGQNAWQTFVVLPREAPAIAYRYFTDRASFYRRARQ